MNNTPTPQQSVTFDAFLPVVILSVALLVILVWTLVVGSSEYAAANRQRDQLVAAQVQAGGVEQKVKSLMEGLLTLAESDPDAKAIAEKYQIRFNAPPADTTKTLTPEKKPRAPAPAPAPAAPKKATPPAVTSAVSEASAPVDVDKGN